MCAAPPLSSLLAQPTHGDRRTRPGPTTLSPLPSTGTADAEAVWRRRARRGRRRGRAAPRDRLRLHALQLDLRRRALACADAQGRRARQAVRARQHARRQVRPRARQALPRELVQPKLDAALPRAQAGLRRDLRHVGARVPARVLPGAAQARRVTPRAAAGQGRLQRRRGDALARRGRGGVAACGDARAARGRRARVGLGVQGLRRLPVAQDHRRQGHRPHVVQRALGARLLSVCGSAQPRRR